MEQIVNTLFQHCRRWALAGCASPDAGKQFLALVPELEAASLTAAAALCRGFAAEQSPEAFSLLLGQALALWRARAGRPEAGQTTPIVPGGLSQEGQQISYRTLLSLRRAISAADAPLAPPPDLRLVPDLLACLDGPEETSDRAWGALLRLGPELLPFITTHDQRRTEPGRRRTEALRRALGGAVEPPKPEARCDPAEKALLERARAHLPPRGKASRRELLQAVSAMTVLEERTDELFAFLSALCDDVFSGDPATLSELELPLTAAMAAFGTREALTVLERHLSGMRRPHAVIALALELDTPGRFYKRYGENIPVGYEVLREALLNLVQLDSSRQLDARWLDVFIARDDGLMVTLTAQPGHARAVRYLLRFQNIATADRPVSEASALLAFSLYPLALLRLEVYDFWAELWFSLRRAILCAPPDAPPGWLSDARVLNILRLNGPWLAYRLSQLASDRPWASTLADALSQAEAGAD